MTASITVTETQTFTLTHAKHLASKVATDLLRLHHLHHDVPSLEWIDKYEAELVALLKHDYVSDVTYGFKRNGKWVEALRYTALPNGDLVTDSDPGKIRPVNLGEGTAFTSFLNYNSRWLQLSMAQREEFESALPFRRTTGEEPGIENGYWSGDLNYTAGGRGMGRSSIKR